MLGSSESSIALPIQATKEKEKMNTTDIRLIKTLTSYGHCRKHDKGLTVTIEVPRKGDKHFVVFRCDSTINTGCDPDSWDIKIESWPGARVE